MKLKPKLAVVVVVLAMLAALASLVVVLCSQLPVYDLIPLQLR